MRRYPASVSWFILGAGIFTVDPVFGTDAVRKRRNE
jgi:hypothetical protein